MTTPVGDMDISGPPSTQQAQHLGVVRTKSGAAPSISPQLENTALGDMAHAIESLAPQLVGKGKNEQLDLLQKIHNKIFRMIVDVPSGRSTAPFEQDVQRICALKTLLTNTSRALAHHPEAARYLEHMAYAIDRLEARIEKNFGPNDATKRYTDLQAVAAVSVGLCGLGGSRDKVLLWEQKMQEALAEIETSYADRHELEQTMRLLTHTKRNIKGLTRQWMVLSIGRAEERIASHLQPMIRHIFEEASTSANPAAVLQHEFSTVEALYGADDSFLPFMRDARRLLVLFQTRSAEEARSFLIPLLRYTLCPTHPSPITSPIHGHQVAAQALFMLDQAADQFGGVVSSDFSKSVEALGRAAADLSSRGALQRWEELLSVYKEPYDSEGLKQIFLPAEMARQLVLADGSLNLGFVSIAKDSLLAGRTAEEKKTHR